MQPKYFAISIFIGIIVSTSWILIVKNKKKVFTRRTLKYLLLTAIISALIGAISIFIKPGDPSSLRIDIIQFILLSVFFLLGCLHNYFLRNYFHWSEKESRILTLPFTLLSLFVSGFAFLLLFILLEGRGLHTANEVFASISHEEKSLANNLTMTTIVGLLPFFLYTAHTFWNKVPVTTKYVDPWLLDISKTPPVLEPGDFSLYFRVPYRFQSKEFKEIGVDVQLNHILGDVFHHILDDHNMKQRSIRPFEIAEEKKKAKVYGWLFYKVYRKWWKENKEYIDPYLSMKALKVTNNEIIYVERVKTWI